jgi:hypothetical protein
MSVANLTRYNVRRDFQDKYDDCKMLDVNPTGELIKFEDFNQLKAEILTLVHEAIGDIKLSQLENAEYWLNKVVSKLLAV